MPALSVVLPTHNRWPQLQVALAALARQTVPRRDLEIVVVSDGSTDGTDEALRDGQSPVQVTFIQQSNQGPAVARNAGVAAASGDLILFIDDDVVAEPGCAAAHIDAHGRAKRATVVIGPLLTPEDWHFEPWVLWEQRKLEGQYRAMAAGHWAPTARQFYTGNASLTRRCFIESGGFDASFRRGEDVELAYRLAEDDMVFTFEFEARAFHHAQRSYESWLSNAAAYGRNDALMWRDHGQSWLLPTIRAEHRMRNPLIRAYTRLGIELPAAAGLVARALPGVAGAVDGMGLGSLAQPALSAVYNLAYYRGLIDELGGLEAFRATEYPSQPVSRSELP